MALPSTPAFERMLSGITLVKPGGGVEHGERVVLQEARKLEAVSRNPVGGARVVRTPGVTLFHPLVDDLSLDALARRVEAELKGVDHVASREMALLSLGLFATLPPSDRGAVERFNEVLKGTLHADVSLYAVLPGDPPENFEFRLGPFTFGPLDTERLGYRCERARSDAYKRMAEQLRNALAVTRDVQAVKVLPWVDLTKTHSYQEPAYILLDEYFACLHTKLFDEFWSELAREQELPVAAGAPYIDERKLRGAFGIQPWAVFLKTGRRMGGWVVPGAVVSFSFDFCGADRRFPEIAARLRDDFDVQSLGDSEVHRTLSTYTRFIFRAHRHEFDGNQDEAFLHFVISLDLLLSEGDELSKTVMRRAACLVHRPLSMSFERACRHVRGLYDARSKYVHEGRAVKSEALEQVKAVAREVLWCLMRAQRATDSRDSGFVARWLKRIDHLCSAFEIDESPPGDEWARVGIEALDAPEEGPG